MGEMNSDELFIRYGTDEATVSQGGEHSNTGDSREVVVEIDLTDLGSTAAVIPGGHNIFFPKNARIEEVEIVVDTAATSGGAATLDIGLVQKDLSTEIDYEAFANAVALTAIDAAGEKQVLRIGSTGVGQLVGTTTSNPGYITANYNTAAFTAGVIRVRIRYYMP